MINHSKTFTAIIHGKNHDFKVTIADYGDYSDAEVQHKGTSVSLGYIEQGELHGEPGQDNIIELCINSGLKKQMVDWAYSTDSY